MQDQILKQSYELNCLSIDIEKITSYISILISIDRKNALQDKGEHHGKS